MSIRLGVTVLFFFLDQNNVKVIQKIASKKAKLGEKVGKYNRLSFANDCVEMKKG